MERRRTDRWPGNVRELENLVRRLAALYSQEVIEGTIIDAELGEASAMGEPGEASGGEGLASAVEADPAFALGHAALAFAQWYRSDILAAKASIQKAQGHAWRVTGSPLDHAPLVRYLRDKYTPLYGL